jgi:solute:Na+ symporter, SSS family
VLYPRLEHPENAYMMIVNQHVPHAIKGVIVAGFMAAFMSTIATQLNWGASYLVADFYRRFIRRDASERHYVQASRVATVVLVVATAIVAAQLASIRSGWEFVLELGAGTGAVYLLRWYWWRINAWSEISAMATAMAVSLCLRLSAPFSGGGPVVFAKTALTTVGITTVVWLAVTFLTRPEPESKLVEFYRKTRPDVRGWQPVARLVPELAATRDLGRNLASWALGCAMVYSALLGTGWMILGPRPAGATLLVLAAICAWLLYGNVSRGGWETAPGATASAKEAPASSPPGS